MCLYDLAEKDGKTVVVDFFSKRRIPSDEEVYILATRQSPLKEEKKEESSEPRAY